MKRILLSGITLFFCLTALSFSADNIKTVNYNDLPNGAKEVITKIKAGSTEWAFVKNDGVRFGNREKHLPADHNVSYKEYTVCTDRMNKELKKGKRPNRGPNRIVHDVSNDIYYYTDDHYRTFRRVVFK